MITRITLPQIGEIQFDSELVPEEWAGDSYAYYMNVEPPYKGESPGEENFFTIEKDGKKILIFSQSHPGAICMYINELFVDMDCVYDCENIAWTYGGIPYGTMECGYTSVSEMPSFCQDIMTAFINSGLVFCAEGSPYGKYYAIPINEDYYSSRDKHNRHKDYKLWAQTIEPQVEEACKKWLSSKITEMLNDHAMSSDIFGDGDGFWYESSLICDIREKSNWANKVLFEVVNDFMRDSQVSTYIITAKVIFANDEFFVTPLPTKFVCTELLPSKNKEFCSLFSENNEISLKEWLTKAGDYKLPFAMDSLSPVSLDYYLKKGDLFFSGRKWDMNNLTFNFYRMPFETEPILTFADFAIVKQEYKRPVYCFD